ncbi:MAG: serine--tRNA ligase [Patescibacteria group bacterium]
MIDIDLIRNQPDRVEAGVKAKGFDIDLEKIREFDENRRHLQVQIDGLRAKRNALSVEEAKAQGGAIKQELASLEEKVKEVSATLEGELLRIPNLPISDVPVGAGESANTVIKTVGDKPNLTNPKDHLDLGLALDLIDMERAAKVSGGRFNFLKNELVLLELAMINYAFAVAIKYGYTPLLTPELVNRATVLGTGYLPYGEEEVYKTQDDLYLIGTSELAAVAYHADELLEAKELPKRYVAFSSCYRREAGTYGKDMRGILRQHQFMKVEMVSLVEPEESEAELAKILMIEEEVMQGLGLPYQVVQMGTGDLGMQAAKKFDIEAWLPAQNTYRETHSCSNTTDFQTRRLNIRYKADDGTNRFVHALNGTVVSQRPLIAIMENNQQADGSIKIPEVLVKYTGFQEIRNPKHQIQDKDLNPQL